MAVRKSARGRGRPPVAPERILDAACRVFSARGYFGATVEDVVAEAGVGKGTLYRHFRDKEKLLTAILGRTASELDGRLARAIREEPDIESQLMRGGREMLAYFAERPGIFRIFIREGALALPAVRAAMRGVAGRLTGRIAEALKPRVRGGALSAAEVFNSLIFGLLRRRLGFADKKINPKKDAEFLVAIFLRGIQAVPRR